MSTMTSYFQGRRIVDVWPKQDATCQNVAGTTLLNLCGQILSRTLNLGYIYPPPGGMRLRRLLTKSLWIVAFFLASAVVATAEKGRPPNVGFLDGSVFASALNSVCGIGEDLSQGCVSIRERDIADASAFPWRAVGRVNFASERVKMHCTGALVSERVVLTASHCLYNFPRKSWVPAESIVFVAGYQRGVGVAVSKAVNYIVDTSHNTNGRDFLASLPQDWALIVLKDPIGRETGFLPIYALNPSQPEVVTFRVAGYAGLRPHVLSIAADCGPPKYGQARETLLLNCSTMQGDSGAPTLALIDGEEKLVGVLVGAYLTQSGAKSVSIPISRFERLISELTTNGSH